VYNKEGNKKLNFIRIKNFCAWRNIIAAILLVGVHLKGYEAGYKKDTCTPSFIAALFTIGELWK
jgi:hypothetical protein